MWKCDKLRGLPLGKYVCIFKICNFPLHDKYAQNPNFSCSNAVRKIRAILSKYGSTSQSYPRRSAVRRKPIMLPLILRYYLYLCLCLCLWHKLCVCVCVCACVFCILFSFLLFFDRPSEWGRSLPPIMLSLLLLLGQLSGQLQAQGFTDCSVKAFVFISTLKVLSTYPSSQPLIAPWCYIHHWLTSTKVKTNRTGVLRGWMQRWRTWWD